MSRVLIVDGNSILNRAFYGVAPLTASDGTPTGAVYGFIKMLKWQIDELKPDYLVCAFDLPDPTFRHKMYDGYKANRSGMPDDLAAQLPFAKASAEAMGFMLITKSGYEADDIIGTVAAKADTAGIDAYVYTGDRDSLQLISEHTRILLAKNKGNVIFDRKLFFSEYGVYPEQFVDVKALMGDSSDNIPGVRGIGEKTALKLIADAGDLDTLYSSLDSYSKGAALTKLTDGKESAYLSRTLAKINTNVPEIDETEVFSARTVDESALLYLFNKLEFTGLAERFGISDEENVPEVHHENACERTECTEDEANNLISDIDEIILFDNDGKLEFFADGKVIVPESFNPSILSGRKIICFDSKSLYKKYGLSSYYDVMLAAYLLSPGEGSYSIERLSKKYLGYEASGADTVAELYKTISPLLENEKMTSLLLDIEIPLALVLADMENCGFKVDCAGIREYMVSIKETADSLAQTIYIKAGTEFNINSPKQLGEILFERLGLPAGRKTKSGYATDAETLEKLRPYSDIVDDILDYRQLIKLYGTYGEALVSLADENGKIHTTFNQTGTATGRLSSSDPNMQNIPVREMLGRELRKYFTADGEGRVLIDADYSQIELRLLAELSGDETMKNSFISGEDIHRRTAAQVFGLPLSAVTPELRSKAKAVNFGIVYGIGAFSLAKNINVPRKVAGEYIDSYLATYPDVDKYLKKSVENAKEDGFTSTMFGRRRYIPELKERNFNVRSFGERVAMNAPVQGTAADIIKIAMVNVSKRLKEEGIDAHLILQVHDELIIDSSVDCAAAASSILKEEMENAVKTDVPLSVEVSSGFSWYEAK